MPSLRLDAFEDHKREWDDFDYVYPVLSRRAKGISVGINLNPDKVCNFDCVYCEVDRNKPGKRSDISLPQISEEVTKLLDLINDGTIYNVEPFKSIPIELRRLNDIAFSGDGEPTTCIDLPIVASQIARILKARRDFTTKLILITDSSNLLAPHVVEALEIIMCNRGEIWAKLDAGSQEYYQEINRTHVPFSKILHNIEITSIKWPITIQALFLRWKSRGPSFDEIAKFTGHLSRFEKNGSKIQLLQIYTVARPTPEKEATALTLTELIQIKSWVSDRMPNLPIELFEGNA